MIPYVRNHDHVRTPSWSRTYAIMITYVRNHDLVRTQSWSRTYAIMISYVRNHDPVRTQYIPYVRNHDLVRTQLWSRTYAIMILYVRNHDTVRNYYPVYTYFKLLYFLCTFCEVISYASDKISLFTWVVRDLKCRVIVVPLVKSTLLNLRKSMGFRPP